jgi:ketosteroid isomerase-like protein
LSEATEVVRRVIEAHNRGAEALLESYDELLDPDFVWTPVTVGVVGSPDRASYHGREGVRRYYDERAEAFGGGDVQIRSCEPAGDRAVLVRARSTARGRGSGIELEEELTLVYWVRDGKVVRGQAFRSLDEALEAANA